MTKIFSNLGLSVVDGVAAKGLSMAVDKFNSSISNGFHKKGPVRFYYKYEAGGSIVNVLGKSAVSVATKLAQDEIMKQYNKLISKKVKLNKKTSSMISLIKKGNVDDGSQDPVDSGFGSMLVNNGTRAVIATDAYGNKCVDAFMMAIPLKNKINISQKVRTSVLNNEAGDKYENNSFSSDSLVWWDCTAIVTISSDRNIIATKVAGRDYSRKELVSNGDISISVSGRLNSHLADVYPTQEVKKFIQIMNYKGAIRVNNQFLSQLGIDRIVIQNFNMPQKEGYKNIQEYTFTALGMQPDKETKVSSDTIVSIDQALIKSSDESKSEWKKLMDKKLDGIKSASSDAIGSGLSMSSGILLNSF